MSNDSKVEQIEDQSKYLREICLGGQTIIRVLMHSNGTG